MLFQECLLYTATAVTEGCFGHLYHQPANAYRIAALKTPNKINQKKSHLSRSISRDSSICTLSNNRRTLSLQPQNRYLWPSFAPPSTIQNQADNSPPGRDVHLI